MGLIFNNNDDDNKNKFPKLFIKIFFIIKNYIDILPVILRIIFENTFDPANFYKL
jgi:hypothetical protein